MTVIEEFNDHERRRLVRLVTAAIARCPDVELLGILARLSGTDTVLMARRDYASRAHEEAA